MSVTCSEFLIAGGVALESCSDDLIGTFEFSLDENQLVQTFHSEGTSRLITRTLGGPCGYVPPGEAKGCSGWGCGVILLIIFLFFACEILTNTDWLRLI